jgi:DNA polymerase-3 subunit alpha
MTDFVHLHVHSEYSLLDGLPHPKDLAARASELDQNALALTDHGSMFAAIEFYDACKSHNVKPIIGVEAYLAARTMKDRDGKLDRNSSHILLLAENDRGYRNLLKLVSLAELEGFYYYPRIDLQLLEKYSEGIICTSGCPSSQVPRLLLDGRKDEARRTFAWYRDVFKDRFYLELQEHGIAEMAGLNKELIALSSEFNVPLVATNDAHYLRPEDAVAQDILICIQTQTVVTDPKRLRMDGNDYYLKSSAEMRAVWNEQPDALKNTLLIAERCNVDLDFKGYRLPAFSVPTGFSAQTYLRHLCEEGFMKHYPDGNPDARKRLEYELGVIHNMGFDTYFLIVWDLCREAREKDIWYNVRGSAAGSIAAYTCNITNLDPLQHGLIFERFLNPGRITMPDIDLDFQDDRRQELIEYTMSKCGRDNVAQIVTFSTRRQSRHSRCWSGARLSPARC